MDETQLSVRERKKQETKDRILNVAVSLFQDQGFDDTSFEQVAEEASVSRATVFNYFPSKRELLRGIAIEELGKLQRMIGTELQHEASAVAQIRQVMRQLVSDTMPYLNVTRYVIVSSMLYPSPEAPTALGLGDILEQLVSKAQAANEIRSDLRPVDVVHAISGAYLAVFFDKASHSQSADSGDEMAVADLVDMLFEGIGGPSLRRGEADR